MGFPNTVGYAPAPAVEGDFCDANPRSSVNAGPGGLVAGSSGVTVGRFAWATSPNDANGAPATVSNAGTGAPTGFVHREMQALNTLFLSESGSLVPPGTAITLFKTGGFWAINRGTGAATMNQKVFAKLSDGTVATGAAGATITGFVETKWFVMSPGDVGTLIKISATPNG